MRDLIEAAGIFIYPLGLCSIMAFCIIVERLISLRTERIIPRPLAVSIVEGSDMPKGDEESVTGRILKFYNQRQPDPEQLKSFARLQIINMERGMFILDVVVAAAPLLGLLGTVVGLVQVFSKISAETGLPDPAVFVEGVALALSTTVIGLAIAIPAIVFNSFLIRRIDTLAARLSVLVDRLVSLRQPQEDGK